MSIKNDIPYLPTPVYSNVENEIESLLPSVFDFSVTIPSLNKEDTKRSRRFFSNGETIKLHIHVRPNLNDQTNLKKFKTLFDVTGNPVDIWKSLFHTLQISALFTNHLPSNVDNDMIVHRDGEIITSYTYKSKTTTKKIFDSSSVYQTRVAQEIEGGLVFEVDLRVPKRITGQISLVIDFFIFSEHYDKYTLHSFQDVFPDRSRMEKSLNPLTSSLYLNSFLFLGSLAIPVKISNPLVITSTSKLLNMKGIVQCTFENSSESNIELKSFAVHVLATKTQPIIEPEKYRDVIPSTTREIKLDPLKSPFNFVYENLFPVKLAPGEKYSMLVQVYPNHVEINEAIYSSKSPFVEYSSLITMDYVLEESIAFSSEHNVRWNFVQDRGLIVSIESPPIVKAKSNFNVIYVIKNFLPRKCDFTVTIQGPETSSLYCVENVLNIGTLDQHQVKKLSLTYHAKRGGTFDIFELVVFDNISKETFRSLCKRKVFVQEDLEESDFEHVDVLKEERKEMMVDVPSNVEDFGVLANENSSYEIKVDSGSVGERKPVPAPNKRVAHLRSRSNEINVDIKPRETLKAPFTPDIDSFRSRGTSSAVSTGDFVPPNLKDDKSRRKSMDGEEIALDSPTFVDDAIFDDDTPLE